MRFDILTIFPEIFDAVLGSSIIGRAREKGLVSINTWNIRDYTKDRHKNRRLPVWRRQRPCNDGTAHI